MLAGLTPGVFVRFELPTELVSEFMRWQTETRAYPARGTGASGPTSQDHSFYNAFFEQKHLSSILKWLTDHELEVDSNYSFCYHPHPKSGSCKECA